MLSSEVAASLHIFDRVGRWPSCAGHASVLRHPAAPALRGCPQIISYVVFQATGGHCIPGTAPHMRPGHCPTPRFSTFVGCSQGKPSGRGSTRMRWLLVCCVWCPQLSPPTQCGHAGHRKCRARVESALCCERSGAEVCVVVCVGLGLLTQRAKSRPCPRLAPTATRRRRSPCAAAAKQ